MSTFCSIYIQNADLLLFLNLLIQFSSNKVTNLHQLTSQITESYRATWRSYRDHRFLWRQFTLRTLCPEKNLSRWGGHIYKVFDVKYS